MMNEQPKIMSARFGRLSLRGCKDHPGETTLSCSGIRTDDGRPLTNREVWEVLLEFYEALKRLEVQQ
jgi:hypothetical protein